jgi:hypothetical protein
MLKKTNVFHTTIRVTTYLLGLSALGACATPTALSEADIQATVDLLLTANVPTATLVATIPSAATSAPAATAQPTASFEAATYRDASAAFEFAYPVSWTVGPVEQHSRGGITAFSSWSRPTDVLPGPTPAGETRMDATVQLWEPTNDLAAFLGQREAAWDGSGITIVTEERWVLSDGRPAAAFVVEGSDGSQGFFFFTTLNDKYLVLSGEGDLALLAEIARTVRPIEITY